MPSLKAIIYRELFRLRMPKMRYQRGVEAIRQDLEALAVAGHPPPGTQVTPVKVGDTDAVWVTPPEVLPDGVILYLHGGAYIAGSITSHTNIVGYFAQVTRLRALLIDYRLAPEHPFPAALDDATAAYHWLLAAGIPPSQIVVMGDSAGGGLTMATLVKLRDDGVPLPAAAVVISPWADLTGSGESIRTRARHDPWLDAGSVIPGASLYHGEAYTAQHPLISPLYADLHDLPPILIHVGDWEILRDDSTRLAGKIREAGGEVELKVWGGMWHVFHGFGALLTESSQAVAQIAAFTHKHLQGLRSVPNAVDSHA